MRILKRCSKCKKLKSLWCFRKDKQKKDGLYSSCHLCWKKRYDAIPDKKNYNRERQLRLKYGLTMEEYALMSKKQNGCCAICGGKNKNGWMLAVDHDHKTGKNRGLLCASCNVILGTAYDNKEILIKAIKYLEVYH